MGLLQAACIDAAEALGQRAAQQAGIDQCRDFVEQLVLTDRVVGGKQRARERAIRPSSQGAKQSAQSLCAGSGM